MILCYSTKCHFIVINSFRIIGCGHFPTPPPTPPTNRATLKKPRRFWVKESVVKRVTHKRTHARTHTHAHTHTHTHTHTHARTHAYIHTMYSEQEAELHEFECKNVQKRCTKDIFKMFNSKTAKLLLLTLED